MLIAKGSDLLEEYRPLLGLTASRSSCESTESKKAIHNSLPCRQQSFRTQQIWQASQAPR